MNRTISAFKTSQDPEMDKEIDSFIRGFRGDHFNTLPHALGYEDVWEEVKTVSKSRIVSAHKELKSLMREDKKNSDLFIEVGFLETCLENLDEDDKILIEFL